MTKHGTHHLFATTLFYIHVVKDFHQFLELQAKYLQFLNDHSTTRCREAFVRTKSIQQKHEIACDNKKYIRSPPPHPLPRFHKQKANCYFTFKENCQESNPENLLTITTITGVRLELRREKICKSQSWGKGCDETSLISKDDSTTLPVTKHIAQIPSTVENTTVSTMRPHTSSFMYH